MTRLSGSLVLSCLLALAGCSSSSSNNNDAAAGSGGSGGSGGTGGAGAGGAGSGGAGSGGAGSGGSAGNKDGGTPSDGAAKDGGSLVDGGTSPDGAAPSDGPVLTGPQARGKYLVGILGCGGCHTPPIAGSMPPMPDTSKLLSGVDCFVKDMATGGCLSSANLTPDDTGLKKFTDQQIMDAFRKGIDPESPDGGTQYLFARMPYYQFAALNDEDAKAIVAYLRQLTPVAHEPMANTAPFDKQPTAAEWVGADTAKLPAAGTGANANGMYLSTLLCATCHTVNAMGAPPLHIEEAKAYEGGKDVNAMVMGMIKVLQSPNVTPDATGIMGWSAADVLTTIQKGQDPKMAGRALCGMRANAALTAADAMDIANYVLALPPKHSVITSSCQ